MMSDHRYQLSKRIQCPSQKVVPKHEDLERHEATKGLQTAAQLVVPQFQVGKVDQGPGRGHGRSHGCGRQRWTAGEGWCGDGGQRGITFTAGDPGHRRVRWMTAPQS